MRTYLLATCLVLGTLAAAVAHAGAVAQVVVRDPFLDLHAGPGRGYPVTQTVDRGATVDLLRQRTDWIKVRTARGLEGWVHRSQLTGTLTSQGDEVRLAGPSPEARTEHRWEIGLGTGDFGGQSVVSVTGSYSLTESLVARADVAQLLGNASNGWLGTAGLAHVFMPGWRVSPFVGIGAGVVRIEPKATLVQPEDRTDSAAYAGIGLRGYLTNRFLLQAEYREFVIFTSRDDNEEIDEWTAGFTYYF